MSFRQVSLSREHYSNGWLNGIAHTGAAPMDEWTVYRISGEALEAMTGKKE